MASGPGQPPPEGAQVKDLILQSLRESVKRYPDVKPLLRGDARWIAEVYTYKVGEAPDDDVRRKDERRLELRLREFLEGQLERLLKQVKDEFKSFQPSFWDEEERLLWEFLSNEFVGIIIHGTQGGLGLLGANASLVNQQMINSALIEYARLYRNEWLHAITETTRKTVADIITNWLQTGDPLSELVKTLSNPELGLFSKVRAKRIAVTEVTRLHAMGNEIAWKESGTVDQFNWMTAADGLVCDRCKLMQKKGPYPLDQLSKLIPDHVNCRCWGQPIVNLDKVEELGRQIALGE